MNSTLPILIASFSTWISPQLIAELCRQIGYKFRVRQLDPWTTIHALVVQALHGNTALSALRHQLNLNVTVSALCQARQRLPLALLHRIVAHLGQAWSDRTAAAGLWLGHRVVLIDGSSTALADKPNLHRFGYPSGQRPGLGRPVAHLLAVFHAGSGLLLELIADVLHASDLALEQLLRDKLRCGDVLVGDRAFCSYPRLAALAARGVHAVVRINANVIVSFQANRPHAYRPQRGVGRGKGKRGKKGSGSAREASVGLPKSRWLKSLGHEDQLTEWFKAEVAPAWMDTAAFARLPETMVLRELRYAVDRPGFRTQSVILLTTLRDEVGYPKSELAKLYGIRWEIEGHLRNLKTTMKMEELKCHTEEGMRKELAAYAIAYNLVRLKMLAEAEGESEQALRVSFADAMRALATALVRGAWTEIRLIRIRLRVGRFEPREVVRRPKPYKLMTKPRSQRRNELLNPQVTASTA